MRKIFGILIIILIILGFTIFYEISRTPQSITQDNFSKIYSMSIIGKYQSDSAYSIGEIYYSNSSVFISPFLWNMKYAKGLVNMTYNKFLYVNVALNSFKKINPKIGVDGYPGLMYGQECWFPFAGKTIENSIYLPIGMSSLSNFSSTLSFHLYNNIGIIDDFSYDIWLSQNPNTTYLKYPDIELMIWLYHDENLTSPFIRVGNISLTLIVNGTKIIDNFNVYILPHTGSADGWIGVYYVSQKELEGNVSIPLSFIIKNEFSWISKIFHNISSSEYYLDGIQVGMEFNDINGTANLGYTLYLWEINSQKLIN